MMDGIRNDLSHKDYLAIDRVSNSYLSRLAECPGAAKVPQEETPAMTFGRALHSYILDGPESFSREVAITPEVNRRTNDGKAVLAAFLKANDGKAIISVEEHETIIEMDKAVKAHPMARGLIGTGTHEVSVFWTDSFSGLECKARPDIMPDKSKRALIDLKKTRDASPHGFQRSIVSFGYHRQAAFYLDGLNKVTGENYDVFAFVAVEDSPPYRVEVYTLSPTFIDRGRVDYQMLITLENRCRMENRWPHYQCDTVTEIEMPKYLAYQEEVA